MTEFASLDDGVNNLENGLNLLEGEIDDIENDIIDLKVDVNSLEFNYTTLAVEIVSVLFPFFHLFYSTKGQFFCVGLGSMFYLLC